MPDGVMGDRAAVIFAAPEEINKMIEARCCTATGSPNRLIQWASSDVSGWLSSCRHALDPPVRRGRWLICFHDQGQ
jgi:hypothetical protein